VTLGPRRTIEKSDVCPPISAINAISSADIWRSYSSAAAIGSNWKVTSSKPDLARNLPRRSARLAVGIVSVVDENAPAGHAPRRAIRGRWPVRRAVSRAEVIADYIAKNWSARAQSGGSSISEVTSTD